MINVLWAVAIGLATAQLTIFVTTVYLHRGVTHGALRLHTVVAFPCRLTIWLTSGIRPREWAGVHRRHHAAVDTADDPHSPAILGAGRVFFTNLWLYRTAAKNRLQVDRYTRDLSRDRWDRVVFDRETLGPLLGAGLLCAVFGWYIGLLAALVHAVTYVGLNGAINSLGHTRGARPNDNSGTNGRLLGAITAGEGLHNNHHAGATAARLSWHRSEIDPGWWVIRSLTALRLCELRHKGGLMPASPPAGHSDRLVA